MNRIVLLPPDHGMRPDGTRVGGWWHVSDDSNRLVCDLCPRACHLKPGDRGFCFVRQNVDGEMRLTTFGRSTGFCIDPIEKKPLNHFLPGTSVLSFGTAGCNLGCKFCQNWDISKSREVERLSQLAQPDAVAAAAAHYGCRSVAYTYNDPVIWAEYAIETARACRAAGIRNVAVTAGYITPEARGPFFDVMDAANVDLKSFSETFYHKLTYSHLAPVLDTIEWLHRETAVWIEITNLIIPEENDSPDELRRLCDWVLDHVGDEVPVHFSAFHPDFRLRHRPPTPHETLLEAYEIARRQGIRFVYVGNVHDARHQSTYCPECHKLLVQRDWYELGTYELDNDRCRHCGCTIAGVFEANPGTWGRKRQPVDMRPFAQAAADRTDRQSLVMSSHESSNKEEQHAMTAPSEPARPSPRLQAQRPKLSESQQQAVHQTACEIIAAEIAGRPVELSDPQLAGAVDRTVMGAFVTLKRKDHLRACCGALGRPMDLLTAVREAAKRTATEDSRFPAISPTELPHLDVEVSLLYAFQTVPGGRDERLGAIQVGRHGLQIQRGNSAGLLLPNVATEQGYDGEEFLRQVCRKAGLPPTAWQDEHTQLQTFESSRISAPMPSELTVAPPEAATSFTADDARQLAEFCRVNLGALLAGATPSYYLPGAPDGTAHGLTISVRSDPVREPWNFFRISLRPGMPLQSSLFSLTETVANALRGGRLDQPIESLQLGISILTDPAMHGTVADPDLRGFDPATRALLVMEGNRSAWLYDPQQTADSMLSRVVEAARVRIPDQTLALSFAIATTEASLLATNVPQPWQGPPDRPPAVAGKFYPSDIDEMNEMLDEFFAGESSARPWPAAMVPHAGWIYSGAIAARVLQAIEIPDRVIILAPKHTRPGPDWSVTPCQRWLLPGGSMAGDPELATTLANKIDHLELDALAHANEHAIEVQLPLLARLAPETRVVGITLGGSTDWKACRQFAAALAGVLESLSPRPLLLISTDMNHYAPDGENRQLDEIALEALEDLDPERLFHTVKNQGISMCGLVPAVIVQQTLRELGGLTQCERIAYATSADAGGSPDRVVGYAGMLFA